MQATNSKKAAREARPIGEAVLIRMLPKSTISFSCEEAEEPQAAQARRSPPSNRRRPSRTAEASHRRRVTSSDVALSSMTVTSHVAFTVLLSARAAVIVVLPALSGVIFPVAASYRRYCRIGAGPHKLSCRRICRCIGYFQHSVKFAEFHLVSITSRKLYISGWYGRSNDMNRNRSASGSAGIAVFIAHSYAYHSFAYVDRSKKSCLVDRSNSFIVTVPCRYVGRIRRRHDCAELKPSDQP